MYFVTVNLYELGQFLQILLWILLPVAIVAVLITTYMHYRRKSRQRKEEQEPLLAVAYDGWMSPDPVEGREEPFSKEYKGDPKDGNAPLYNDDNAYKGLIWMKDKYEEYREQSDIKYERLKEELAKAEQKYLDLLAARPVVSAITLADNPAQDSPTQDNSAQTASTDLNDAPDLPENIIEKISAEADDPVDERDRQINLLEFRGRETKDRIEELERQYMDVQEEMHEKEAAMAGLYDRLTRETARVAELTGKLESNMRLLLNIHKEVNSSLNGAGSHPLDSEGGEDVMFRAPDPDLTLAEETKIVGWVESDDIPAIM